MSSTASAFNGSPAHAGDADTGHASPSLAAQLKALHADSSAGGASPSTDHGLAHNPTVEEVVDEEDIVHPPPAAVASSSKKRPQVPLDMASEEAFPSLAPAKPAAPVKAWGRGAPAAAPANGTNGSTGKYQAQAAAGAQRPITLPGRAVERISFAPGQMLKRQDLKKPVPEILRDLNKKSKANVTYREGGNGHYVFEAQGPLEAVRQALKEVAGQVGTKLTFPMTVPVSVRSFLIGRQGQTITGISKRSGAKIQIPKQEEGIVDPNDEDATIDIIIEGDAVAVELARQDIQKIIDERTSSVNMRLREVPPELYPFLIGPREVHLQRLMKGGDVNLAIPTYHTWTSTPPPPASAPGQPVPFTAQPNLPIRISGERRQAQEIRERIEAQAAKLLRSYTSHPVEIERGRHQFIIGQDGEALHDLLDETGCSVVVPPSHDDSETLYIIGPPDRIDNAVNKVLDTAASMSVSNIDVARQHARGPRSHPHDISRYLRERQALADLEKQFSSSFVLPVSPNSPANWQIFSKDGKQGMRARQEALNLIAAHTPSRFYTTQANPFYHSAIRARATGIRRTQGVHLMFPESPEDSHVMLVFEEVGIPAEYQFPRQTPDLAAMKDHEYGLKETMKIINSITQGRPQIVSQPVEAPAKFHDRIKRFVDREQRGLGDEDIPPQLLFAHGPPNAFNIRGHSDDVEALNAKILAFIEQEKKDELERGYTMSFEYPHKIAGHLVGKGGENIKKLQEEYDVEINYSEGKVELKGPQAKCEACKAHVLALVKKIGDETTHSVKIPTKHHADLKGSKGSQVLRLQERYNVRIQFPRQIREASDDDAATEASFRNHSAQAADVVTIRGTKKGADEARDELLNLLQYAVDNSHTATVSVAAKQIPSLIGSGGRELESLRTETGCYIDIPKREANTGNLGERIEVTLKGTKQAVDAAKKIILEKVKTFDDQLIVNLDVHPKHYKNIIGPSGTTLQSIIRAAGGPEDRRLANKMVQFPKNESNESTITLQGPKVVVEKIRKDILSRVTEREGQVTETLTVPAEKHRALIGAGGSVRRKIDADFTVEVNIPKQGEGEDVTITGKPENVAKAKAHIEGLVKEQASETVNVPTHLHHVIAEDGGAFIRRLRSDLGIKVDHGNEKPPPRREAKVNGNSGEGQTEEAEDGSHTWYIVHHGAAATDGDSSDTIPWVLRGNAAKLPKARELVESAIVSAGKPSSAGRLTLADPRRYRFVIGPGGSTVTNIRSTTGAQITVPRQGSATEDQGIEVKGSKDGVLEAKKLILEALTKGGEGGGRRRRE